MFVRNLNADSALPGHRCDDTYSLCCETQSYIVLKIAYFRYSYSRCRGYLIECDGRAYGGSDGTYLNVEVVENLDNLIFFQFELILADK